MFGLSTEDMDNIIAVLQHYPEVESAVIFGSRAKGNYRNGSDVDIALKGTGLTYRIADAISGTLNEDTLMPYHFDVLNYHTLTNTDLADHVDRVGKDLYNRIPSDL